MAFRRYSRFRGRRRFSRGRRSYGRSRRRRSGTRRYMTIGHRM